MIRGYTEHSANERTFLAWVRTGIAVTAFGFLIEKFEVFSPADVAAAAAHPATMPAQEMLRVVGRYDGFMLAVLGMTVIVFAAIRFVRIRTQLDDTEMHRTTAGRFGMAFSAVLALILATASAYLALG